MGKKLLVLGGGNYSLVVKEIAQSMCCFDEVAFLDDSALTTPDGTPVLGKLSALKELSADFTHAVVALGSPSIRAELISRIEKETACELAAIVSPLAYIAPSAVVAPGCIIEPMAVVHSKCTLEKGCIVSAGAVINHFSHLCETVHIDCNATVSGFQTVPAGEKVMSGTVFNK